MRVLRGGLAALCLLLLLACGTRPEGLTRTEPRDSLPPGEIAASRRFAFYVSADADPVLRAAAELFATKLGELTDGGLAVTVSSSVDASGDFLAGRCELAFLDSAATADRNGDFALLSGVMRYRDYETLTMGLNSERMLGTLNDRLGSSGILLLAAFYQGSGQLVADRGPVGGELLGDPVYIEADEEFPGEEEQQIEYGELSAAVQTGSAVGGLLEAYGMAVREAASLDERAALLADGEVNVAEFSRGELERVMLPAGMHYLMTSHNASPLWLAVKPSAYNALPGEYKAAVSETLSYLFPLIDEFYLGRDAEISERLRQQGIAAETRLDGLRGEAALLLEENPPDDAAQKYMLGILSGLS